MIKENSTIGIPRGLLYYRYKVLWETFFKELGVRTIVSPKTNKEILRKGIQASIDESCLSSKVYLGHVDWLISKADYIFVPRIASYSREKQTCTKLFAMPDIVENTFDGIKILTYNLDRNNGKTELSEFIKLGLQLNKNPLLTLAAYRKGKEKQIQHERKEAIEQQKLLENTNKLKILLASHSYNISDELIGGEIVEYLKKLNVEVIYADKAPKREAIKASYNITKSLYWPYNQEIVGAIQLYKDKIDGVIFVTTFPCGPDSLVCELCMRKIKDLPLSYIVIDELQGEAGIHTRLESFVDIISARRLQYDKAM